MDMYQMGRFTAVLEMLKTSKTIERVDTGRFYDAEQESAIKYHCHKNMIHNRIALVRQKGILTAKLPNSAWPMILNKFSDVPDVLYYLLQQKHGAMFGPLHHGRKRKQDFD
jgi:predicted Rossmann fold nucleotide-binding protein DprA/Smf involved in DNA uptake